MKTSKSNYPQSQSLWFVYFSRLALISSCGTKSSTEETAEQTHEAKKAEGHEHDSEEAEHHDHDEASANEAAAAP